MSEMGIFMVTAPGLEAALGDEAREKGFRGVNVVPGGVEARGDWSEIWRANLEIRGAVRILARFAEFRAFHLAQLDKRSRKLPWGTLFGADQAVWVEATTRKSKIYHAGAAAQRIGRAITETVGARIEKGAALTVKARIDDNLVTLSLDTSGEALHKRGLKQAVGKAPMRENMAALFLRMCGYDGTGPVVDPMCGSGTFPIEAAEIAAGLSPGRARGFAFEDLAGFDAGRFAALRREPGPLGAPRFYGFDRDQGAISGARANAERAGLTPVTRFECAPVSDLAPPEGPKGLVIANPPYGGRIGNRKLLFGLYGRFGQVLRERFRGWRVGVVTSDAGLARAMEIPFEVSAPVAHGGIRVNLFHTGSIG